MSILGKTIKRLRRRSGQSQSAIASRLQISIPAYSKIETGITDVNISRLMQLAALFEVTPAYLIYEEGENDESNNEQLIRQLEAKIAERDKDIINLQRKLIDLYDEARANQY